MNKKLSVLFIFMLLFQSMSGGFAMATEPKGASDGASKEDIFSNVKLTDVEGNEISDNAQPETVNAHIGWTLENTSAEDVKDTYNLSFPKQVLIEKEKSGDVVSDEDTALGSYSVSKDGVLSVSFDGDLEEHSDASGEIDVEGLDWQAEEESQDVAKMSEAPVDKNGDETKLFANTVSGESIPSAEDQSERNDPESGEYVDVNQTQGDEEQGKDESKETEAPEEEKAESEIAMVQVSEPKDLGDIFTDVTLFRYDEDDEKKEIKEDSTIEIEDGTEFGMKFDWELEDGVDLNAADYATIEIPDVFDTKDIPEGKLKNEDDDVLGNYEFENGKLKVIFNEKLVNKDNRRGAVGFDIQFNLDEFDEDLEQEVEFGDPINKTFTVKTYPNGEDIKKSGELEEGPNPDTIAWTIDVNTNLASLNNGKVTDEVPKGVKLDKDNFKFYELDVKRDGEVTGKTENENLEVELTDDGFKVELGETDKAYRIEYSTKITDFNLNNYTNKASLIDNGEVKDTDDDTIKKVEQETYIEKSGDIDKNPKDVTWTIDINKKQESLTNAEVTDSIPYGLSVESIKVYDLEYKKDEWTTTGEPVLYDNFSLEFEKLNGAKRIVVETAIDFDEIDYTELDFASDDQNTKVKEFINKATLTADKFDESGKTDDDTVTAKWDKLVAKTGKDVTNYGEHEMKWTVTLNKAQLKINDAKFVDVIGEGQELIKDSIEVTDGKGDVITSDFDASNLDLPDGIEEKDISFGVDLGTIEKEIEISYRVKIIDTTVDEYKNRGLLFGWIGEGNGPGEGGNLPYLEDHDVKGELTVNNKYSKEKTGINYEDKTMGWEITTSSKADPFEKLKIKDDFKPEEGMVLLQDTIEVEDQKNDRNLEKGTHYTLTKDNFGFTITFKDKAFEERAKYKVTFDTSFDPNKVEDAGGSVNEGNVYKNDATFTVETKDSGEVDFVESDEYELDDWISDYGKKEGTLDRENRKISWEIYTNPLGHNLSDESFKISDKLTEGQTFDESSLDIYKYSLDKDGDVTEIDEFNDDYTLNTDDDESTFTVTFEDGIEEPVLLKFDSDIEGLSKEDYKNTADVTGEDLKETYNHTVPYKKHNKFVDKNSDLDRETAYTDEEINWTVTINESLSSIEGARFEDTISDGQILDESSIKLDGNEVNEDNLTITNNNDGTTDIEIELGNMDPESKDITYTTIVTASEGTISNNASLYGNDKDLGSSSVEEFEAESASWGTGEGDEKRGSIEIVKVDEEGNTIQLPAEFELYYKINDKNQIVTGEAQETESGKVQYGNLPYRTYYLVETEAPKGYNKIDSAPDGYELNDEEKAIKIVVDGETKEHKINVKNSRIKTEISGDKIWKDNTDATGDRPDSVTIQVKNGDTLVDEKKVKGEDDENDWEYSFTDLYKYDKEGNEINYTIEEDKEPEGYKATKAEDNEYNIINTRTGKTDVEGTKTWKDGGSSSRPDSITVNLSREVNGEPDGNFTRSTTVEPDEQGEWNYEFTDLERFDENGVEYDYTVEEEPVSGYSTYVDDDNNITNTRTGTAYISGTKSWEDDDASDRPDSITVNLLRNGRVFDDQEVTAEDDWEYSFTSSRYNSQGHPYSYSVKEQDVPGYDSNVDGYDITNTRSEEKTIEVTKSWLDDDASDRPESVEVELFRSVKDGDKELVETFNLSDENDWSYDFEDLPAFDENGKAYTYSVEEESLEDYDTSIDGYDITNTRKGTTSVDGEKTWIDDNLSDRPDTIKVNLLQNGNVIDTTEVTAEEDWTYSFTDLDQYDEEGVAYTYTVKEQDVPGYDAEVDGFDIINTRSETKSIEVTKSWQNDEAEDRPNAITVELLQNGDVVDTVDVTARDDWTHTFKDLDAFDDNGVAYEYSVEEQDVEGYTSEVNGFDITNTHEETDKPEDTEDPNNGGTGDSEDPGDSDDNGDSPQSGASDDTNDSGSNEIPKTATNMFNLLALGALLTIMGLGLTVFRKVKSSRDTK